MKIKLGFLVLLPLALCASFINKDNCSKIINKQAFTICYDYEMKGAKYVTYRLDGLLVNKLNIKKRKSFYSEKNIPKKYRSQRRDYVGTGYDRGHLAPDASFDYNEKILRKTYTMANIIPQAPTVNRRLWFKVERLERKIAVALGYVDVINGIVYGLNPKRIGKNKIAVPEAFWKIIYNDEKNYKKCFLYQNDLNIVSKGDRLKNHLTDCTKLGF
jgi:endonuclease G